VRSSSSAACRDRGAATLELVVLGPVVILLSFAIVQAALTFYARNLALAAAQAGVSAGRSYGATAGAGPAKARAFLTERAGDSLRDAAVSDVGSTAAAVRITVTGRSLSVLPGVPGIDVSQVAEAGRERFTTPEAP
jgi:Flp pilus assembly protein TadG